MNYKPTVTSKFLRVSAPIKFRRVEAGSPLGRMLLNVLDSMSMGAIGDALAARGLRLSQPQIVNLVDVARRVVAGDPNVRLDPHAEVAFQILSETHLPNSLRQKFTPLHTNPAEPGLVTSVAYESGLSAILQQISNRQPVSTWRIFPWLRQINLPVDGFLRMPVSGLSLMEKDGFGRWYPVAGRTATINDLLALHQQAMGSASQWTVTDASALRQSIQDAVQVLRGPMNQNARVEAICQGISNALVTSSLIGAASVAAETAWLGSTLPSAPDGPQLNSIMEQSTRSAYDVPLNQDRQEPGAALRQRALQDAWNTQSGANQLPGQQGATTNNYGLPVGSPGWESLPAPERPLPTNSADVQPYNLQTDDWLQGRN